MNNGGSPVRKTDLEARLVLLQAASQGQLDALPCPACAGNVVSVWFTRRSEDDYWTWFTCAQCGFEMRAQGGRPAHYSAEREREPQDDAERRAGVT